MKRLLIFTGPQGSGNHLWARIMSSNPRVKGWSGLFDKYWEGHDREPMAEFWQKPETLTHDYFSDHDFFFTSISCPYFYDGIRCAPKYEEFTDRIKELGIRPQWGILTRDGTITRNQQQRVRGGPTLDLFKEHLEWVIDTQERVSFISLESLMEWKDRYLRGLCHDMDWPFEVNDITWRFLETDPNAKYVDYVKEYWLDSTTQLAAKPRAVKGDDL
jgi:hypothetical protein